MQGNKPVDTFRCGSIKATVWGNEADGQTFYNVTFSRGYKVGDTWKDSDSFGFDDLLVVAKLADLAHTAIMKRRAADAAQRPAPQQQSDQRGQGGRR